MKVKILYVILVIIGLTLMINGAVGILQRDKQQEEQYYKEINNKKNK